jgi:hypothetical protein
MQISEVVASLTLAGVLPSGETRGVCVQVGKPYHKGDHWRCPVAIPGLHHSLPDIAGDDAFQSLCLALRFVQSLLQDFVASGGRLLFPDTGDDWPMEAYFSAVNARPEGVDFLLRHGADASIRKKSLRMPVRSLDL